MKKILLFISFLFLIGLSFAGKFDYNQDYVNYSYWKILDKYNSDPISCQESEILCQKDKEIYKEYTEFYNFSWSENQKNEIHKYIFNFIRNNRWRKDVSEKNLDNLLKFIIENSQYNCWFTKHTISFGLWLINEYNKDLYWYVYDPEFVKLYQDWQFPAIYDIDRIKRRLDAICTDPYTISLIKKDSKEYDDVLILQYSNQQEKDKLLSEYLKKWYVDFNERYKQNTYYIDWLYNNSSESFNLTQTIEVDLDELQLNKAISWMYENDLTIFEKSDTFLPYNKIRRDEAIKIFVKFAKKILDLKEDSTSYECESISDLDQTRSDLQKDIISACKLWIFDPKVWNFYPDEFLTNDQAIVFLIRLLDWFQTEAWDYFATKYYQKAKDRGILNWLSNYWDDDREFYGNDKENLWKYTSRWELAILFYNTYINKYTKSENLEWCWMANGQWERELFWNKSSYCTLISCNEWYFMSGNVCLKGNSQNAENYLNFNSSLLLDENIHFANLNDEIDELVYQQYLQRNEIINTILDEVNELKKQEQEIYDTINYSTWSQKKDNWELAYLNEVLLSIQNEILAKLDSLNYYTWDLLDNFTQEQINTLIETKNTYIKNKEKEISDLQKQVLDQDTLVNEILNSQTVWDLISENSKLSSLENQLLSKENELKTRIFKIDLYIDSQNSNIQDTYFLNRWDIVLFYQQKLNKTIAYYKSKITDIGLLLNTSSQSSFEDDYLKYLQEQLDIYLSQESVLQSNEIALNSLEEEIYELERQISIQSDIVNKLQAWITIWDLFKQRNVLKDLQNKLIITDNNYNINLYKLELMLLSDFVINNILVDDSSHIDLKIFENELKVSYLEKKIDSIKNYFNLKIKEKESIKEDLDSDWANQVLLFNNQLQNYVKDYNLKILEIKQKISSLELEKKKISDTLLLFDIKLSKTKSLVLFFVLVSSLSFWILSYILAYKQRRNKRIAFFVWFVFMILGLLFYVAIWKKKRINCSYCSEKIHHKAKKCKHCGEWIKWDDIKTPKNKIIKKTQKKLNKKTKKISKTKVKKHIGKKRVQAKK